MTVLPFLRDPNPTRLYRLENGTIRPVRPAPRVVTQRRGDGVRFAAFLEARGVVPAPVPAFWLPLEPPAATPVRTRLYYMGAGFLLPFLLAVLR